MIECDSEKTVLTDNLGRQYQYVDRSVGFYVVLHRILNVEWWHASESVPDLPSGADWSSEMEKWDQNEGMCHMGWGRRVR